MFLTIFYRDKPGYIIYIMVSHKIVGLGERHNKLKTVQVFKNLEKWTTEIISDDLPATGLTDQRRAQLYKDIQQLIP